MTSASPLNSENNEKTKFITPQLIDKTSNRVPRSRNKKPTLGQIGFVFANRVLSRVAPYLASLRLQKIFETPRPFISDKTDLQKLATGKISWLTYDGTARLPLYSFGEGPTILLIHGLSGSGTQLCAFIDPLIQAGFRVIICDLPAHGRADGKRISFPQIANAIKLIGEKIGPVSAIIAHSNGAATAGLALSRGLKSDVIVFLSPPEDLKGYLYGLAKMIGFRKTVTQHAERQLVQEYGLPFDRVRGSTLVANFTQPALILHDENDKMVAFREGEKIAQHWKGSHLVRTKGLGHNRILKDPDVISLAVNFISHHRAPD